MKRSEDNQPRRARLITFSGQANTIRVTLLSFSILGLQKQPIALLKPNRVHLTRIATELEQCPNSILMLRPLLRFRDEIFDAFSPVKSSPTSKKM